MSGVLSGVGTPEGLDVTDMSLPSNRYNKYILYSKNRHKYINMVGLILVKHS